MPVECALDELPPVKILLQRLLVAVCALYLGGAHWGVLQLTAWTGMLVARTQQSDMAEAVKTTFDGEHPCGLCTAITAGQMEERKQAPDVPVIRKVAEFKGLVAVRGEVPQPRMVGEISWTDSVMVAGRRMDAPPTPPPLA